MKRYLIGSLATTSILSLLVVGCAPPPPGSNSPSPMPSSSAPTIIEPGPGGIIYETPSGAPTTSAEEYDEEKATFQEGLVNLLPADQIPVTIGNVTEELGKEKAINAYSWAASVAASTMYMSSLWDSYRADKEPKPWEFSYYSELMVPKVADQWLRLLETEKLTESELETIAELIILPEPLPEGAVWAKPTLQQWQFKLLSARIAPASDSGDSENASRPIEFQIKASALASYSFQGKFYQFNVERTQKFVMVQSADPTKPWVLLSWDVESPIFSEVVEFGDAPAGIIVPTPVPTEVSEGTPIPDPDYPAF